MFYFLRWISLGALKHKYLYIHIIYTNSISGFNIQFRIANAVEDACSAELSVSINTPKRITTGLESVIPCPRPRSSSWSPRLSNISTIAPSCNPTPVGCTPTEFTKHWLWGPFPFFSLDKATKWTISIVLCQSFVSRHGSMLRKCY